MVESADSAVVALIAYIYALLTPVGLEKVRWRPGMSSVNLIFRKLLGTIPVCFSLQLQVFERDQTSSVETYG